MNRIYSLATLTISALLLGCADPPETDDTVRVEEVRPDLPKARGYGLKFELTRDSEIALTKSSGSEPLRFSRYQGSFFADPMTNQLSPQGHRIVMDIRSLPETTTPESDDSRKKGQSPYLTLLFEQVTETDTPGTYDCVGSLAHRGTKETVEFPATFTIEGDTLQMEAEIKGNEVFASNVSGSSGEESLWETLKISASGQIAGSRPERIPSADFQNRPPPTTTSRFPARTDDSTAGNFSWRASAASSTSERVNGLLSRHDQNKDQKVTRKEAGPAWEQMASGDTNGDGILTRIELESVRLKVQPVGQALEKQSIEITPPSETVAPEPAAEDEALEP